MYNCKDVNVFTKAMWCQEFILLLVALISEFVGQNALLIFQPNLLVSDR